MKKLSFFFILFVLLNFVVAIEYPKLTNFVTDNADIIDENYETQINELAKKIEQETTVEVAVVTIDSLEGLDIETYAVELFKEAGIGKKDINNGLLMLIVHSERKYRIEVGYGLESTIPDIRAREIGVNVLVPNFKNNEYGKGIYDALNAIYGYVTNNEEVISKYKSAYVKESNAKDIIALIIFVFLIIFIIALIRARKKGKKGKNRFFPIFWPGFGGGFNRGGFSGGGFGGFGGGFSGGGGASGGW